MMPLPDDEAFTAFVDELSRQGASVHTIASALNHSAWADPSGRKWHWRQVSAIADGSAEASSSASPVPAPPRADLPSARRLAVLRALRDWRPFDQWNVETIWECHEAGDSLTVIARTMNQAGVLAPDGRPWTRFWINVMLHVQVDATAGADRDAWVALTA